MPKQRSGGPKNVPPNKKYRDCFFLFSICASLQKRGYGIIAVPKALYDVIQGEDTVSG
jgi:hypothetical protein